MIRNKLIKLIGSLATTSMFVGCAALSISSCTPIPGPDPTPKNIVANMVHDNIAFYNWNSSTQNYWIHFQQIALNYTGNITYSFSLNNIEFVSLAVFQSTFDSWHLIVTPSDNNLTIFKDYWTAQQTASHNFYVKTTDSVNSNSETTLIYDLLNIPSSGFILSGDGKEIKAFQPSTNISNYDAVFIPNSITKIDDNVFFTNRMMLSYKDIILQDRNNYSTSLDTGLNAFSVAPYFQDTTNLSAIYVGSGDYFGSSATIADTPEIFTIHDSAGHNCPLKVDSIIINGNLSNYARVLDNTGHVPGSGRNGTDPNIEITSLSINGNISVKYNNVLGDILTVAESNPRDNYASLTVKIANCEINSKITASSFIGFWHDSNGDLPRGTLVIGVMKFNKNSELNVDDFLSSNCAYWEDNLTRIIFSLIFDNSVLRVKTTFLNFANANLSWPIINDIEILNNAKFYYTGVNPPLHVDDEKINAIPWQPSN